MVVDQVDWCDCLLPSRTVDHVGLLYHIIKFHLAKI